MRFFKLYFAEILLVFVAILCAALGAYSVMCLKGIVGEIGAVVSVLLLAFFGYHIQKLEKIGCLPSLKFAEAWAACFISLATVLVVGTIKAHASMMLLLYIPLIILFVMIVAIFGYFWIIINPKDD